MIPPSPGSLASFIAEAEDYKYGTAPGQTARLHRVHGFTTPDLFYEALCLALVDGTTDWLDIGGGRSPFPYNASLARHLAERCGRLTALDPGPNLPANGVAHARVALPIESYRPDSPHDLATLRMVAEHIADPQAALAGLAHALRPGGLAVVYTVDRRSPTVLLNRLLPLAMRRALMRVFGGTGADVFPTWYRLNRPSDLRRAMASQGMEELWCLRVDDCRATLPWPRLHVLELRARRTLRRFGMPYPEACILAIYRRRD